MRIDILTLFPEMFTALLDHSMIRRALDKDLLNSSLVNIRDFAANKHLQVDDYPYGGGAGMVMKPDVLWAAVRSIRTEDSWTIFLSPQGKTLKQSKVQELAEKEHLILICGHYEGIDERVMGLVDEEISVGDYVLTGGELPAMILFDAVARLIPGVLGSDKSALEESFDQNLLEYPQYTRPRVFENMEVPDILLSGHHENIRRWRKKQSLLRTLLKRPDLLLQKEFDIEEKQLLEEILFSKEL